MLCLVQFYYKTLHTNFSSILKIVPRFVSPLFNIFDIFDKSITYVGKIIKKLSWKKRRVKKFPIYF